MAAASRRAFMNPSDSKTQQPHIRKNAPKAAKISVVMTSTILIFSFLIVFNYLIPNPTGAFSTYLRVRHHVGVHFSEYNLSVGYPQFNLKDGHFRSVVTSRDDESISFEVASLGGGRFWNTYREVFDRNARQILEEEFGDDFSQLRILQNLHSIEKNPRKYKVNISIDLDSLSHYVLFDTTMRCWNLLKENGGSFSNYTFNFINSDGRRVNLLNMQSEHMNEELLVLLEDMYDDFISTGNYSVVFHDMAADYGFGHNWASVSFSYYRRASITINTEEFEPKGLFEEIDSSRQHLEKHGFEILTYFFNFVNSDNKRVGIYGLKPEHTNEELILVLEDMYNNFISKGHYKTVFHNFLGYGRTEGRY